MLRGRRSLALVTTLVLLSAAVPDEASASRVIPAGSYQRAKRPRRDLAITRARHNPTRHALLVSQRNRQHPRLGRLKQGWERVKGALRGASPPLDISNAARDDARALHRKFPARIETLTDQAADPHLDDVLKHSEQGGRYLILSDLHWGLGRTRTTTSGWYHGEDFRKDGIFARFVKGAAAAPEPTTLVFNGDWIEFIRHKDADATLPELQAHIRRVLSGHRREVRALAEGVARGNLRVVYTRGNHDVQLVDPRVRAFFMSEIARVGQLTPKETRLLHQRMAWGGHAAVIGRYGEGMIFHGDVQDAVNNWRSPANPYDGRRRLESNMGWQIVSTLLRPADMVDAAMTEHDKVKAVARYLRRTVDSRSAGSLLIRALLPFPVDTPGERLAAQMDDRVAMRAWVRRSGIVERTSRPIPGARADAPPALGELGWIHSFEQVFDAMPEPVLDRLRSNRPVINVFHALMGFGARMILGPRYDRQLLDRLGGLPNVRYVVWGHSHGETAFTRGAPGKGVIEHVNSGTWTPTPMGWPLNVGVATPDADGRLALDGLHRTERSGAIVPVDDRAVGRPAPRVVHPANEALGRLREHRATR
jgi:UDP-2,3-diacylglucosamine pyrophosphatase LpxH